jgi:amidase
MPVSMPPVSDLLDIAGDNGLSLTHEDAASFQGLMAGAIASYKRLDQLPEAKLAVVVPRDPGYRPDAAENPYNGWYWKTDIRHTSGGLLAGKSIAIKDNICVAGVPLMNGSKLLEGFVPDVDATLVTRILEAGGTIAGKAACEDLCFSGGSHTNATGPIRNPHKPTHSAGGSSGGSAVVVAAGDVPMAVGGDQGGSIRTPASWCGVYGLKPTWGLVPTSGAMPISYSMDHLGPMCATVEDTARLLSVIAGHDGWDSRTIGARTQDYMKALGGSIKGLKIAVLKEAFEHVESDGGVNATVRAAIDTLRGEGAEVTEISIPEHLDGPHIWSGIILEGAAEMMIRGNGFGSNIQGYYPTDFISFMGKGFDTRMNEVSDTVKMVMLLGEYMHRSTHGTYHAKAQNLRWGLRAAYDAVLAQYDIIAMPTIPFTATEIPAAECSRETYVGKALDMQANTCPFDVSGHPAFTIPVGMQDALPVGMMLVGRHFDESTLLRAAHVFETSEDWTKR